MTNFYSCLSSFELLFKRKKGILKVFLLRPAAPPDKGECYFESNSKKKLHIPTSKAGKILTNLLVTLAVGGAYFYVSLPALNLQSNDFYSFMILLCVVYVVSA